MAVPHHGHPGGEPQLTERHTDGDFRGCIARESVNWNASSRVLEISMKSYDSRLSGLMCRLRRYVV